MQASKRLRNAGRRDPPSRPRRRQPVEAAPQVDGLAGGIDFDPGGETQHHNPLSVESTRRRPRRRRLLRYELARRWEGEPPSPRAAPRSAGHAANLAPLPSRPASASPSRWASRELKSCSRPWSVESAYRLRIAGMAGRRTTVRPVVDSWGDPSVFVDARHPLLFSGRDRRGRARHRPGSGEAEEPRPAPVDPR